MLQPRTRWKVAEAKPDEAEQLAAEIGTSHLVAQLLLNRGIRTAEQAKRFLNINEQSFYDPFLMKGMTEAVERIKKAVEAEEDILVFGDYDADGVTSTSVMVTALKEAGALVDYYIPNRFTEGYGPNLPALKAAKEAGVSLVVTVDTGIAAVEEAEAAREMGLDFIITDHHQPPPVLPEAYCIINPHQKECLYPFKGLSGAGVALKVAHALLDRVPDHLLDLAVLGTIADLVPLVEENRLLAVRGLTALKNSDKPGIRALLKVAGIQGRALTAEDVGFALGPRLNAVGRLDSAEPAVQLLLSEDPGEAETLAKKIDALNRERKKLVNDIADEAVREIEERFPPEENSVFVLAKDGWNPGVIGIVASRLVDRFGHPAIVMGIDPETGLAKGSARSIEGFDIYENLSACRDLMEAFGGHPMAAGMTVKAENLDELRARLNEQAAEILTAEDFLPVNHIDLCCSIDDISLEQIEEIQKLAPFGSENPLPKVMIEKAELAEMRPVGTEKNHLKAVFTGESTRLDSIGFRLGHLVEEISAKAKVSVVGQLEVNEWNGTRKPQILLDDLAVTHWQLFDCRHGRNLQEHLGTLSEDKRLFIAFQRETLGKEDFSEWVEPRVCLAEENAESLDLAGRYAVLLDLPNDIEQLEGFFRNGMPERVYAVFHHEEEHFFSTLPSREQFKWFYAFLLKRKSFQMEKDAERLEKAKGWSRGSVAFMANVFSELHFITIDQGWITLNDHPEKRDLSDSRTFCEKQRMMQLENDLCYASYASLKQTFETMIRQAQRLEEAVN
ncbi:MAG TPA: single-stranded-DNA-specific exonuclease RecJ [Bacillales bacterium]|nr:single-stranded-DNA-specific exonuclease RecJ [Bacillales bacterium]